jgi:hypothetical protein
MAQYIPYTNPQDNTPNPYYTNPSQYGLTPTSVNGLTRYVDSGGNYYNQTASGFQPDTSITPTPQRTIATPSPVPTSTTSSSGRTLLNGPNGYGYYTNAVYSPGYPGDATHLTAWDSFEPSAQSTQPDLSGLSPAEAGLYKELQTYLDKLHAQGQTINPNVQITPEQAANFLAQAHGEIDPYYQTQAKLAKDDLLKSLGYSKDQIAAKEVADQATYAKGVRSIAGNSAEQGLALSGGRVRQENDFANTTNASIDAARRQLSNSAQGLASDFAAKYGGASTPTFNLPSAPRALAGIEQFQSGGGETPFYNLSPDIYSGLTGSEQYKNTGDVQTRASQLEQSLLGSQAINQSRTLNV